MAFLLFHDPSHRSHDAIAGNGDQHMHLPHPFLQHLCIEHCVQKSFGAVVPPEWLKSTCQTAQNPCCVLVRCHTNGNFSQVLHIGMPGAAELVHLTLED